MRRLRTALTLPALTILVLGASGAFAQTTINPDISVIPRFLISTNDGGRLAEGKREFSRPDFQFEELEIAVQAYLNPFARADVILTLPGPDVEQGKLGLEEVYATVLRGLPLDLNLRFGKYRAEFGKLNQMHPHAWPFVSAPLVEKRFLGEALNDLGISASLLIPTGEVYTRLTVDLLRGSSIAGTTGLADSTGGSPLYANSARLMSFFTLSDESDLELGISGYTGIHDPYNHERFWYGNLDFKYKYRPSSYTSLVLQGEYLYSTRRAMQDEQYVPYLDPSGRGAERTITSGGLYVYADLQFIKILSIGARYDQAGSPYHNDDKAHGVAVFFGYYPVEETLGLRLEYANTVTELPGYAAKSINSIYLQALFSLGPHKAHPF